MRKNFLMMKRSVHVSQATLSELTQYPGGGGASRTQKQACSRRSTAMPCCTLRWWSSAFTDPSATSVVDATCATRKRAGQCCRANDAVAISRNGAWTDASISASTNAADACTHAHDAEHDVWRMATAGLANVVSAWMDRYATTARILADPLDSTTTATHRRLGLPLFTGDVQRSIKNSLYWFFRLSLRSRQQWRV